VKRVRKPYQIALIPLGIPDADQRISAVTDKPNTVLFLDALDEDTLAIVDHAERVRMILQLGRDFRRIVITCRTQFFARDEEIPRRTAILKVGARAAGERAEYLFHKIYLSPFTDTQVKKYINRLYAFWQSKARRRAMDMARQIQHLSARPMLLAHIDDLVRAGRDAATAYDLYEEMVAAWLRREEGFIRNIEDLREFSERLAVDIYQNRQARGAERVPASELVSLASTWNIPLDDWKLSGRSLLNRDSEGNFKFAHRSIMEFLVVCQFLRGNRVCLETQWTDQMRRFLLEALARLTLISTGVDFPRYSGQLPKITVFLGHDGKEVDEVCIIDVEIVSFPISSSPQAVSPDVFIWCAELLFGKARFFSFIRRLGLHDGDGNSDAQQQDLSSVMLMNRTEQQQPSRQMLIQALSGWYGGLGSSESAFLLLGPTDINTDELEEIAPGFLKRSGHSKLSRPKALVLYGNGAPIGIFLFGREHAYTSVDVRKFSVALSRVAGRDNVQ
jgi:hypothetical protein